MNASTLTIFRQLGEKLGQDQAQLIVELVQAQVKDSLSEKLDKLSTKTDINDVKTDIHAVELKIESTKTQVAEAKSDIMRYVIGVYLTGFLMLAGAIIGLYFKG